MTPEMDAQDLAAPDPRDQVVEAARALSERGYWKGWLQVELNDALDALDEVQDDGLDPKQEAAS